MRSITVTFKLPCTFSAVSLRRNVEVGLWQSSFCCAPAVHISILRANSSIVSVMPSTYVESNVMGKLRMFISCRRKEWI